MPPPWLKNDAMSLLRAIRAAESAVLIASIDEPTMIALYRWVVSWIALKAASVRGWADNLVRPARRPGICERPRDVPAGRAIDQQHRAGRGWCATAHVVDGRQDEVALARAVDS